MPMNIQLPLAPAWSIINSYVLSLDNVNELKEIYYEDQQQKKKDEYDHMNALLLRVILVKSRMRY